MRSLRPLTEEERRGLEADLKRTKDSAEWKRLFVILSYDEGQSVEDLARLTRLSAWTIEEYLKKYSSHNKTKNDPRGGSSSKLSEGEAKELERHLSQTTYLKVKDININLRQCAVGLRKVSVKPCRPPGSRSDYTLLERLL